MLRQFHYIDQNGKDQGVNVRNRAQELAKLLNDVDAIRGERKKARSNRNKFGGVEGGSTFAGGMSSGSRYGGFGSEEANFGNYSGRVYGDGGGFGGQETSFSDSSRRGERFEEYDEEEETPATSRRKEPRAASVNTIKRDAAGKMETLKKKEPEQDLFDFAEEPVTSSNGKAAALDDFGDIETSAPANGDDDFDDFQSATPAAPAAPTGSALASVLSPPPTTSTTTSSTQFAAPQPVSATRSSNFNDLFQTTSPAPPSSSGIASISSPSSITSPSTSAMKPQTFASTGPNYFGSVQSQPSGSAPASNRPSIPSSVQQPSYGSSTSAATLGKPTTGSKPGGGADAFSSLWSTASTGAGINKGSVSSKGPDLASMAKAKSSAGIWGAPATSTPTTPGGQPRPSAPTPNIASAGQTGANSAKLGNGLDDLLG